MKKSMIILFSMVLIQTIFSQNNVGINTATPHAKAALDIVAADKGVLIPRITGSAKANMFAFADASAKGMLVFQTDGVSGFYFYDGSIWNYLGVGGGQNLWKQIGNDISNTNPGKVGIGTSNPLYPLSLKAEGNGIVQKGDTVAVGTGTTAYAGFVKTYTNHPLYFTTNNSSSPQMVLKTNGRLGLGTNLPLAKIDARDTSENLIELTNTNSSRIISNAKMYFKSALNYTAEIAAIGTGENEARMGFFTGTSLTAGAMKERMTISNEGNVGINTTNPSPYYKLDVKGESRLMPEQGNKYTLHLEGGIVAVGALSPVFEVNYINYNVSNNFKNLKIDNPLCNGNSLAMLFVTPKGTNHPKPVTTFYSNGYWYLQTSGYHIKTAGSADVLFCNEANNYCQNIQYALPELNKFEEGDVFNVLVFN